MTAPMFYKQLRKTTALLVVVFVVFIIHRLVAVWTSNEQVDVKESSADVLEAAESVICHNIVGGAAFSVDSVFSENVRVYFYSVLDNAADSTKKYLHKWFNGLDTVYVVECERNGDICTSYLSPDKVKFGEWSVDLVEGSHIIDSRQFLVEQSEY